MLICRPIFSNDISGHHTVDGNSPKPSFFRPNPLTTSWLMHRTGSHVDIHPRTSQIQVIVRMSRRIAGTAVTVLLSEAYGVTLDVIEHIRDGVIFPPGFRWTDRNGLSITTWNSNNREMTWSDLGQAIIATAEYMAEHGWGLGDLTIYQGSLEVGRGEIRQSGTWGLGEPWHAPHR